MQKLASSLNHEQPLLPSFFRLFLQRKKVLDLGILRRCYRLYSHIVDISDSKAQIRAVLFFRVRFQPSKAQIHAFVVLLIIRTRFYSGDSSVHWHVPWPVQPQIRP